MNGIVASSFRRCVTVLCESIGMMRAARRDVVIFGEAS